MTSRTQMFNDHYAWTVAVAKAYAREVGISFAELDDCAQEALVAMWRCIPRHDESVNTFDKFAYQRIVGAVKDWQRKQGMIRVKTRYAKSYPVTVSLDAILTGGRTRDVGAGEDTRAKQIYDPEQFSPACQVASTDLCRTIFRNMFLGERDAVYLVDYMGFDMTRAGEALGVSESRVSQLRQSGVERAQRALGLSEKTHRPECTPQSPPAPGRAMRLWNSEDGGWRRAIG